MPVSLAEAGTVLFPDHSADHQGGWVHISLYVRVCACVCVCVCVCVCALMCWLVDIFDLSRETGQDSGRWRWEGLA